MTVAKRFTFDLCSVSINDRHQLFEITFGRFVILVDKSSTDPDDIIAHLSMSTDTKAPGGLTN